MHIISLSVENFMGIRAARIPVAPGVTTIAGRNGQGKTSLLNALMWAIGGDKLAPEEPIRRGAKKAEVIVETDAWEIRRVCTKGGSRLELSTKDTPEGQLIRNPQALLDQAVGDLTFDPMAFLAMKPRERAEVIRATLGLEDQLAALDAREKTRESERLAASREKARAAGALQAAPGPVVAMEPIDISRLQEEHREAQARADSRAKLAQEIERQAGRLADILADVEHLRAQLAALETERDQVDGWIIAARTKLESIKPVDTQELYKRLADASAHNLRAAQCAHARKLSAEYGAAFEAHIKADAAVERVRRERSELLASAKIPVEGLALVGEDVTLDGVPFAQASTARQMNAAVALGLAQGREFPLILIRQGSLYDAQSLGLLAKIAEEYRAQVMVEKVTDGQRGPYITIEDGEVVEEPAQGAAP